MVMMAGDIDSRVSDPLNGTSDSPGANDNASGLAGTIEAARVLSKHQFAGSIVYVGLSGEEQGLFGGKILVERALASGWRIKAVLNNDMIGNITGVDGVTDNSTARVFSEGTRYVETEEEAAIRRRSGGEVDSPSRNIARYVDRMADEFIPNLDVMMIYRLDRFGRGGHHRPFNERGIPGVRIMETHEHYHRQHQDLRTEEGIEYGDVIEGVNFDYARKLTALNIVTLAGMASAPPFPANVEIKGAVQPSTTLSWSLAEGKAAENLAGYKVYWRLTTDAQWAWSRYVGITDTYTLENIVIDNYLFGVASVSTDGYESPVVFPGATGIVWRMTVGEANVSGPFFGIRQIAQRLLQDVELISIPLPAINGVRIKWPPDLHRTGCRYRRGVFVKTKAGLFPIERAKIQQPSRLIFLIMNNAFVMNFQKAISRKVGVQMDHQIIEEAVKSGSILEVVRVTIIRVLNRQ